MKSLIQNLPPKHCICIHDYSENYRCVEKNEIQSNYFPSKLLWNYAKGPQDAAGGFVKQQANIAVLRGNTIIQNAKDLFSFCNNDIKEHRSALLKRRIFCCVVSVVRNNIRNFKPNSNNRKIHHLYTSKIGKM